MTLSRTTCAAVTFKLGKSLQRDRDSGEKRWPGIVDNPQHVLTSPSHGLLGIRVSATAPGPGREVNLNGPPGCCLSLLPFPLSLKTAVLHLAAYIYDLSHKRDNKRLVSHGFCHCAQSSLRCSGTHRFIICLGQLVGRQFKCIKEMLFQALEKLFQALEKQPWNPRLCKSKPNSSCR